MVEGERQREAFDRYFRFGGERSIEKLHAVLAAGGRAPCLRTLYQWSTRYEWQSRLAALEREARIADGKRQIRELREMNERQAKLGKDLLEKFGGSLMALDASEVSATVALRGVMVASRLERDARVVGDVRRGKKGEVVTEVKELRLHLGGHQSAYMFPVPES